jgi:hypothetical protein
MFLRRSIPLVLVASVASCSPTIQPTQQTSTPHARVLPTPAPTKETPTADRHLSDYSFGGHLVCREALSRGAPRCQSSYRKARDFIWNHWREKKRAYIVVMITSPDAGSDVHIFIEPDENNVWHVVWRWENLYCASCPKPHTSGAIHQSPEMRSIERKRAGESDVDVPFGTRYLVFLDAHGDEVERL